MASWRKKRARKFRKHQASRSHKRVAATMIFELPKLYYLASAAILF